MPAVNDRFRLGPPDGEVFAWFSAMERPHNDALTLFDARLVGPGLDVHCGVESIAGDLGVRSEFVDHRDGVVAADMIRLVEWLQELGAVTRPWTGDRGWRSFADELRFTATCDSLGHVSLRVAIQPRPWKPSWIASVTLEYALGELTILARELAVWFSA